jgi:hypothetical protein
MTEKDAEKMLEIRPDIAVDAEAIRGAGVPELVVKPNTVEDLSRTLREIRSISFPARKRHVAHASMPCRQASDTTRAPPGLAGKT